VGKNAPALRRRNGLNTLWKMNTPFSSTTSGSVRRSSPGGSDTAPTSSPTGSGISDGRSKSSLPWFLDLTWWLILILASFLLIYMSEC